VSDGDPARLPACLHGRELGSIGTLARANRGRMACTNGSKSSYMVPTDPAYATQLFHMGLTLYFDDIGDGVQGAAEFLRQLETDLGINEGALRMTAWASPLENGAACHYDATDIISIQLRGTKRFELAPVREISNPYGAQYSPGTRPFEQLYTQTAQGFPEWQHAEFRTVEMKPGSVLFFPRGTWHRTHVSADSLAVSIVVEPMAAIDCFMQQLQLLLLQDPSWRKPLYGAWGNGADRDQAFAQAAKLLQAVPGLVGKLSPQDLVLPSLSEEKRLILLHHHSRFQRVPRTSVTPEQVRESENGPLQWLRISFRDENDAEQTLASIEVPRHYIDVMTWIAQQRMPFTIQDLETKFSTIGFDELKHLAEVCTRGGLLKLLWFPAIDRSHS
jgi:hypothetical protein